MEGDVLPPLSSSSMAPAECKLLNILLRSIPLTLSGLNSLVMDGAIHKDSRQTWDQLLSLTLCCLGRFLTTVDPYINGSDGVRLIDLLDRKASWYKVGAFWSSEPVWLLPFLENWGPGNAAHPAFGLVLQRCLAQRRISHWCTGDSSGWRMAPCISTSPWAVLGSWPEPQRPHSRSLQRL